MICPFAIYRPVVNHGGPVYSHHGLVIHVQVGNGSTYGQDNNPSSEVSDVFWCGKDGTLEQHVDTDLMAWTEMAGNGTECGVECEGFPTEVMTPAQIATLGRLFAWGHTNLGWPMQTCNHGGMGLTTHAFYPNGSQGDPAWGGHPCPGALRGAQIPAILAAAQDHLTPAAPHPTAHPSTVVNPPEDLSGNKPSWPGTVLKVTTPPIQWHGTLRWQQRLNGVMGTQLKADGSYGPVTASVTVQFQKRYGLDPDGQVGQLTWDKAWAV